MDEPDVPKIPATNPTSRILNAKQQLKQTWDEYQNYAPAAFFIFGFLFDVFTLDRADSAFQIVQQLIFMVAIVVILSWMLTETQREVQVPAFFKHVHTYRTEILHFFIGGLLSAFTLFFLKSGSVFSSFIFLLLIVAILIANEFSRVQNLGLPFKFGLFVFCLICFFCYTIPILLGFMGFIPFALTITAASACVYILHRYFSKRLPDVAAVRANILMPGGFVILLFSGLYLLGFIPPVPLSLKYVGIYKAVEKTEDQKFALYYERPWWRFWENGDETFAAREGDKIVAFVRVFSPTAFKDKIKLHFLKKDPKRGWETMDRIPFQIVGGRDEGFRGYGIKANYDEGDWRVQVETEGGQEIGRLYFTVTKTSEPPPDKLRIDYF